MGLYLSNWIGLTFGWKLPIDFRGKALATAAATFEGAMRPSKGLEAGYKSYERVVIDFDVSERIEIIKSDSDICYHDNQCGFTGMIRLVTSLALWDFRSWAIWGLKHASIELQ